MRPKGRELAGPRAGLAAEVGVVLVVAVVALHYQLAVGVERLVGAAWVNVHTWRAKECDRISHQHQ